MPKNASAEIKDVMVTTRGESDDRSMFSSSPR
jgi:hypothetical protein